MIQSEPAITKGSDFSPRRRKKSRGVKLEVRNRDLWFMGTKIAESGQSQRKAHRNRGASQQHKYKLVPFCVV